MKYGRFERDDRVRIVMARNDVFNWQTGPSFVAVFMAGPAGPGDTFHLRLPGDDGRVFQLNGNSSEFVAIVEER